MIASDSIDLQHIRQAKGNGNQSINSQHLNIPADWAVLVCRLRRFKQARFFLWLKFIYGSRCIINEDFYNYASHSLQISQKSIDRYLAFLKSRKWIGYNKKSQLIYPRSFDCIRRNNGFLSRRAFLFKYEDLSLSKPFIIASAISIYRRRKEYSLRHRSRDSRGLLLEVRRFKRFIPALVAISNIEIAKYLAISLANASIWKNLAIDHGLLIRERTYEDIYTKFPITEQRIKEIARNRPEWKHKLRMRGSALMLQHSDRIRSEMIICKRNKIRTIS